MRRIKLFSLIQERIARRMFPSRWSARRRVSWSVSGGSAAVESLESRCLLSAGDLDPSFGVAGRVTTAFAASSQGKSVAVQDDGKIVVVGQANRANGSGSEIAVVRYNADGSLDTTFGGTGRLTTDFGLLSQIANDVAIDSDGKIVVAGQVGTGATSSMALVRYNFDGTLDNTFGGTGKVTTTVGTVASANSIAIQDDGKIVVAGLGTNGADFDFAVVSFNADGSLDTSFGGTGKVTTSTSPGFELANSVVIQDNGQIVVAGESALVRYNANGSLDTTFGTSGKVTTDYTVFNAVLQNDGKIIGVGANSGSGQFTLERFNVDGSLDTTFGGTGKVTHTDVLAQTGSVAVQTDGKIVVVGQQFQGVADFQIARYDTDGTLDLTFGPNGIVTTDFGLTSDIGRSITLQSDGRIVVAGSSNNRFAVARYFAAEQPPTFNSASSVIVAENQTNVLTVTATDPESRLLTYGLTGGADQATFAINSFTGALTFVAAPDFENSTDTNHDNIYEVQVSVSDGINLAQQTIAVTVTNTNEAPAITSASSVNVAENATTVLTVAGTDPEHGDLTYSLAGGADDSLFSLNLTTGAFAFLAAPNFESPQDYDHNNVYDVRVSVSDGTNAVTQDIRVIVTNVDESPTITFANTASIAENSTFVVTVTGSDPEGHLPLYGIIGGADQSRFSLNFLTGALSFVSPPDFEHPTDANRDNVYVVQVAVSDGTHLVTQDISVNVTNENETVTIPLPANGGNFKTLFLKGQLYLRSSLGKQLIAPVTLPSGADVQFNGSNAMDRLTLDRSWSQFAGRLTFSGNGGNDQIDARTVRLGITFNGGDGNDTFLGGSGDDITNGGAGLDSLSGNDGNDSLTGGDGNDKLFGGAGGDILSGDAGTDSLSGGDDDDSLSGGDSNDTLMGETGNDTVTGNAGADIINGGDDDDLLFGNADNDTIDGIRGDDVIDGGDDNDNLKGSDGDDAIRGNNGNDTLSGGIGNDLLTGSAGNDSLLGDAGIDTLLGDDGNDRLNGGIGIDIINGILTGPSKDTISDSTRVIDTSFTYDFDALLAELI